MKSRLIYLTLFTLLFTFPTACVYEVATPNVCFQEDVLPIFVNKCAVTGCHNASSFKERLDLSNYDGIMKGITAGHPQQSEFYTEISSGSMPPSGYTRLTKLEKSTIKNWIRMGAPNSSNCNPCDTTFNYSGRIRPLIDKWCIGCHQGAVAGGGYDLSNYPNVRKTIDNGTFLGSIKHQSGYAAMPQGANKLSDCDIKAVENWINAGALE